MQQLDSIVCALIEICILGIIFVVDSADKSRFGEALSELHAILQEEGMRKVYI